MQAYAVLNLFGIGWACNRGFRQIGDGCVAVQMPANAAMNVYGNGWVCNLGYRQVGTECVLVGVATQ